MKSTKKSCDDFYLALNGEWIRAHPVPPDRGSYGAFTELEEKVENDLRLIIESAASNEGGNPDQDIKKIGDFYRSGMATEKIETQGLEPIRSELDRIEGVSTIADLRDLIAHFTSSGIGPLFDLFAEVDPRDSTVMIAGLSQGGLGLPNRDYYTKDDPESVQLRKDYRGHIANMFLLLGSSKETASADAAGVLVIEHRLALASFTPEQDRDPHLTYNKLDLGKLEELSPDLHWREFLGSVGYPDITSINVHQPPFFRDLSSMIASVPLPDWKIFLRWKLIAAMAPFIASRFEQENFAFYGRRMSGQQRQKPRWKRVVAATNDILGDAVGKVYVRQHFSPGTKQKMEALVRNLHHTLGRRIAGLPWMDAPTRQEAQAKLDAMVLKIGYPEVWQDYSGMEVSTDSYAGNILRAARFGFRSGPLGLNRVGKPVDRRVWFMTPQTVNAYYDPAMNEIVFPAAIAQPPFFSGEGDEETNYGAIGAVIGHEITHGFDDMGRKYDKDGNLRDWWTKESEKEFTGRVRLLIDQYNSFEALPGLNVNGLRTLGENIADFGGVTIALHAWSGIDKPPGTNNSGDSKCIRRFFIAFARIWRESITDEELRTGVLSDEHAPGRFRVNGTLFDVPEFYSAFPEITPDNAFYRSPDQRPVIW
jgi:putative endopeptidase